MTSLIVHPVILVLFRVLSLYAHNEGLFSFSALLKITGILLLGVGVVWGIVRFFVRDRFKVGLLLTTLLLAYFFFAPLAEVLNARGLGQGTSSSITIILLGIASLLIAGTILRTKRDLQTVTRGMNVFAACAVAIPVAQLGMQALRDTPRIDSSVEVAGGGRSRPKRGCQTSTTLYWMATGGQMYCRRCSIWTIARSSRICVNKGSMSRMRRGRTTARRIFPSHRR